MTLNRIFSGAAWGVVALLVSSPAAFGAAKPECLNESGSYFTYSEDGVTIRTPNNNSTTAACRDCVDKIVVTGIPAGYSVDLRAIVTEVFTNATTGANVCVASSPRYSYFPGTTDKFWIPDRNVLADNQSNGLTGSTATLVIDYPLASGWHSPELHVDFRVTVYQDLNGDGNFDQWGEGGFGPEPVLVGPYYGGTGGWDPSCGATGCTPGFWKNHTYEAAASLLSQTVDVAFGITNGINPTLTIEQALSLTGGGEAAMLRHAAAAYLTASDADTQGGWCYNKTQADACTTGGCAFCWIGYPRNVGQVVSLVQSAYPSSFTNVKNELESYNATQCSLDSHPRWFGPCCTDTAEFCPWWLGHSVP